MLYRLKKLLTGTYGNDQLNIFLIILGCVVSLLLTLFVPGRFYYLRSLGTIFYIIALCRALSKNIPQRQKENTAFLQKSEPWRKFLMKKFNQQKDVDHKYFNCPQCHRTLRVPRGKGKINITCPHCQRQFKKRT